MAEGADAHDRAVQEGAAPYTPQFLRRYDKFVAFSNRFLWRCPTDAILARYRSGVGRRHLELGVGTGHFPAQTEFPGPDPEITLCDLNSSTLDYASERLPHLRCRKVLANALDPLPAEDVPRGSHDSAALHYLLHCVPGDIRQKEPVLANAATAVRSGGTVTGSTILARGVRVPLQARLTMLGLNSAGRFHNTEDSLDDLSSVLERQFAEHDLEIRGCTALFTGTVA